MAEPGQPLAEVFGHLTTDSTIKAKNPLGVCSIYHENHPVITCPIRFREDWIITDDAASFFFREGTTWSSLTEVRLNDLHGKSAGNVDVVLVAYDENGRVYDFGALEIQAVYISGNVRDPFEHFMKDTRGRASMDWSKEPNYPRPDYLSSSRKRLVPQLLFKGGILHGWKKKIAVALNKSFFATLPTMKQVAKADAHIAWLIYDLELIKEEGQGPGRYSLKKVDEFFTEFKPALLSVTTASPGKIEDFIRQLQEKLDEHLETPPVNITIERPF